jgi:hypothetical protein
MQSNGTMLDERRGITTHLGALAAALFCGAVIAQAYLEREAGDAAPQPAQHAMTLDADAVVGVLNAAFTADGVRNKPRYPMEFETVLGPTTLTSLDRFASAAWPDHNPTQLAAAPTPPAQPMRRLAAIQQVAGSVRMRVAVADPAMLPPARPTYLMPPSAVLAQGAPADRSPPAPADDRRVRLLGLTLPGFVPSGTAIVKTVVSWGGTVSDLVPRI